MSEQIQRLRTEVSDLYALIGGLVSAGSVISLVSKYFRVGLAPILREYVDYYRRITHFFVDWLFFWLPLQLPDWYKDAYVISFVLSLLFWRASYQVVGRKNFGTKLFIVALSAACSVLLLGFALLAISLLTRPTFAEAETARLMPQHLERNRNAARAVRLYWVSLVAMTIASIGFFVLNSQL